MALEIGSAVAVGGSTSIIGAILGLLIKSYFDARKDKRDQQAADVQTDSGIVDNAKKVIDLVRTETDRMEARIVGLIARAETAEAKVRELDAHINKQDDTIARQARSIEWLREDLEKARAEITELRNR